MVNISAVSKGKRHAHALVVEGTPKTPFKCDICTCTRPSGSCRLRCGACDYDECLDCFKTSDSTSKDHCIHCKGIAECTCPDGCPKPTLTTNCAKGRHCRHCRGKDAPCACPGDCTRPSTAQCTPSSLQHVSTNVMLVADASSLMAGKRWASVLSGLRLVKDELREGDKMSVVTFNDTVSTIKFEDFCKSTVERSVMEGVKLGGGARLYDAVAVALHEAVKQHKFGMLKGMPCITHVQVMTCSVDAGSAFELDALKEMVMEANKLPNFKMAFAGLGLSHQSRNPLLSLGMLGDSDVQFKELKEDSFGSSFQAVVSILRAKKERSGAGGDAHASLIDMLSSLASD